MKRITRIVLSVALMLPLAAQAGVASEKLAAACKEKNPGCLAYTLGGADRYWLVESGHTSCDVAADKKTLDTLKGAAQGKASLYAGKDTQPAVVTLLNYLGDNKLQSCALSMNFADLTTKCVSKKAADQTGCHAYIAGVVDVAMTMDRLRQQQVDKAAVVKSPFCENGAPKTQLTDPEIMKAISDYGQSKAAANASNVPAAQAVMEALLLKYSCKAPSAAPAASTNATSSTAAPTSATTDKK